MLNEKQDRDIANLEEMIREFRTLLIGAQNQNIPIPNAEKIHEYLPLTNLPTDIPAKEKDNLFNQRRDNYCLAVQSFIDGVKTVTPKKPEEASCFIRILRFILRSEKLFQSNDEKSYNRQMESSFALTKLIKLNQLEEKISTLAPPTPDEKDNSLPKTHP